jgi:hypothetical protein
MSVLDNITKLFRLFETLLSRIETLEKCLESAQQSEDELPEASESSTKRQKPSANFALMEYQPQTPNPLATHQSPLSTLSSAASSAARFRTD